MDWCKWDTFYTLRPRQNGRHFADGIFKCIFLNEKAWIPIKISMRSVLKGPINNIPTLVQIMAWRRPGYKPLPEPMMISGPTHICVTRPYWVSALAVELRLPCIKPLKLYSVDGNRSIRRSYKSDAKGVKQGHFSFLGTATLSEVTEQAVFSGYTCGYHIGKTNKQRRSQRPWNGYHNLSLQWVIAMSYSFHKHSNWYCYNHSDWYRCGHCNQYRYIHQKISW